MRNFFRILLMIIMLSTFVASKDIHNLIIQIQTAIDSGNYLKAKSLVKELDEELDSLINMPAFKNNSDDFEKLLFEARSPLNLKLSDNDRLLVYFGSPTLYILGPSDSVSEKNSTSNIELVVKTRDGKNIISNKFLSVNGETKRISYSSSDSSIADIDESGKIRILAPGNVVIAVSVDDASEVVPIKVVELPINSGSTKEDVIFLLGFPDKVNEKYISWPNSEIIDGIFYSTRNSTYGVKVVHWIYKKYPEMILSIGGISTKILNPSWDKLNLSK